MLQQKMSQQKEVDRIASSLVLIDTQKLISTGPVQTSIESESEYDKTGVIPSMEQIYNDEALVETGKLSSIKDFNEHIGDQENGQKPEFISFQNSKRNEGSLSDSSGTKSPSGKEKTIKSMTIIHEEELEESLQVTSHLNMKPQQFAKTQRQRDEIQQSQRKT